MELHAAFESLKIGQTCSRPMILVMLAISALPGQGDKKTPSNSIKQLPFFGQIAEKDSAKDSWSERRLHRVPQV